MASNDFVDGGDPFDPEDAANNAAQQRTQVDIDNHEVVAFLQSRQEAYRRVFQGGLGNDVQIVMNDLIAFCRGDTSAFHEDQRIHALLTGRQEVWIRIQDHLRLNLDALLAKYTQPRNKD
jgi:hypothetical protein